MNNPAPQGTHRQPVNTRALKPFIVPIFLPHAGCPHQCVFCNQTTITGVATRLPATEAVAARIRGFLPYRGAARGPVQISFYGGNFLGLPEETIRMLLRTAERFVRAGEADTIRFSTRPDTVSEARLDLIGPFPVETVEVGAQSLNDRALRLSGRGHLSADTRRAVGLLHRNGYTVGLQQMIGLPGESGPQAMASGHAIAALHPAFVRIYPTLVLAGSRLAAWYRKGRYRPLSLEAAVALSARLYRLYCREGIAVARMGLQAAEPLDSAQRILAGPYHPAFGHLVLARVFRDLAVRRLSAKKIATAGTVTLRVHPKNISRMRGQHNENVAYLKARYHLRSLVVGPDPAVSETAVRIDA